MNDVIGGNEKISPPFWGEQVWKDRLGVATKILLVDDERNALLALAKILSEDGYDVVMAGTEEQALAELGRCDFGFIITDLFLLRKSCVRLLERIEKLEANTPVILTSGHDDIDRYIDESRMPNVMRLAKPIEYEELKRLIEGAEAQGKETIETARIGSAFLRNSIAGAQPPGE